MTPSWATLASSAFSRFFMVSRSWRCHTQRTPAGDTVSPDLPERWLLDGELNNGAFDIFRDPVLEDWLLPGNFGQRQIAAFVVKLLEAVEAVPAVAHHLAGLAHVAELLGEFEQANLGADNFLIFGHDVVFLKTPKHGA